MNKSTFFQIIRRREILLFLVLLISGLSLFGWILGKIIIASISSRFIPMAPSTAMLFFILSSLLLVNYNFKKSRNTQSIISSVVILVALFCLLVLSDYFFNLTWDIENIFLVNPERFGNVSIGRMSPITAFLFFFTCLSILADLPQNSNTIRYIGGSFSLLTCFTATVLFVGYLYKAPLLYGSQIIPVALTTAICFLLFSVTLLRVTELKFWTFNLIKKNQTEYLLLKTFLPLVVFVVILQGYLETNFSVNHTNSTLTSAVVILIIVVLTIFVVIKASTVLGGKLMRAENEFRESESRAKAMYQAIPDLLFRLNRQGVFLDYKAESKDLYTQSNENIIGNNIRDVFPSEFADLIDRQISASLDTKTLQTFEYQLPMPGLGVRDYEARMVVCGADEVIATVRDITDRKQAETELREKEIQYRILANSGLALIWTSGPDKLCNYFNEPWLRFTGRSLEQEMGNGWAEGVHPDDLDRCFETYVTAFDKHESFNMEYQLRHVSGTYRWILDMGTPNHNINGEFIGYIGHCFDISDRKKAEKEIKLKNEELIRLNAEKDKFFSIIAHDLRSPFSSFLGLTKIMAEELHDLTMAEIQQIAVTMENSATNLYGLLENLLEWARMQRGLITFSPEIIELHQISGECIALMLEPAKNKGIDLTYRIPAELKVLADRNMLQTVIRNLVSNAMKFTPQGGKVSLSAKAINDNTIEISIRDTGIGMNKDLIDKLFRLDEQSSRPGTEGEPSSGLGLLLCKEFIEKHDGRIWVESEEGKGSTFYFTIPCVPERDKEIVSKSVVSADRATYQIKDLKILIAEDNETSKMVIEVAVKMFGKEVLKVSTGIEAVETCRNNPDIDLVLMDIQMPEMDGYEATRQIRLFNTGVVIIAQTAYALAGESEKAIEAGCNDYISKPISKALLIELIKKHFKKQGYEN